jgi:hypothetical protein
MLQIGQLLFFRRLSEVRSFISNHIQPIVSADEFICVVSRERTIGVGTKVSPAPSDAASKVRSADRLMCANFAHFSAWLNQLGDIFAGKIVSRILGLLQQYRPISEVER